MGVGSVGNVGGGIGSGSSSSNTKDIHPANTSDASVKSASPTTQTSSSNNTKDSHPANSSSGSSGGGVSGSGSVGGSVSGSSGSEYSTGGSSHNSAASGEGGGNGGGGLSAAAANVGGGVGSAGGQLVSYSGAGSKGSGVGGSIGDGSAASRSDPVSSTPMNWSQYDDFLGTLSPVASTAPARQNGVTLDNGMPSTWADFVQNVQNGSLGKPGAAGYGLNYDPNAPVNPLTAAMAPVQSAIGGIGSGLSSVWQQLVANAHAHEAANMANPPFAGAIDTNAQWYKDYVQKYYAATGTMPPAPAGPTTTTVPTVPVSGPTLQANDWPAQIAALWSGGSQLPSTPLVQGAPPPMDLMPGVSSVDQSASGMQVPTPTIGSAMGMPPMPRTDPRGYPGDVFTSDGQVTTPAGVVLHPGTPATPASGGSISAAGQPTMWDSVVDNTGKLLGHTGLGSIVSNLFPDIWNGAGTSIKNLFDNGGSATPAYPTDMATALAGLLSGQSGQDHSGGHGTPGTPTPTPTPAFPDLNHNGIDDRIEGYHGPDTHPPVTTPSPIDTAQFGTRSVTFPGANYRPGIDPEWTYFHDQLARGGVVGYAAGDAVDPRVAMIADAEDALHSGNHQHPAVAKFASTFGPQALKNLHGNVRAGLRMRASMPARQIMGPGGPTDDAVPAVIDGQHRAKLSSGEVVMPVDAVAGAGNGDPKVGAQRLMELAHRLGAK